MPEIILSIIIPTYNQPRLLGLCLQALFPLGLNYEIIVIDDGSETDETKKTAEIFGVGYFYRSLGEGGYGNTGLAVNAGIKKAQGKYIAKIDGDCVLLSPLFLGLQILKEKKADWITSGLWWRLTEKETVTFLTSIKMPESNSFNDERKGKYLPFGPLFMIQRQVLLDMGGYNEEFIAYGGEDNELAGRLGRLGLRPYPHPEIKAAHLWHPPGGGFRDEEQYQRQLKLLTASGIKRNEGKEWGRLE